MYKALAIVSLALGAVAAVPDTNDPARPTAPQRAADEFVIDGQHSAVLFRVQHLSAAPFWGRFNQISGTLKVDDDALDESYIRVEVPTSSVDSNDADRDKHLLSQDFFAAKEFPKLTFVSTEIEKTEGGNYRVTGELEMRGKKKEVTFDAEHTGTANVHERFGLRCGYEATLEIDRTDFGINYGAEGGILSKTVRLVIAIEGKLPK